ncbi:Uncharacterized conserved protein YjgD, DUF1641 family [Planococcus glaciei]|uniref:DUF1641 domain-containing protein n=1 Tax=Planococcus glaciei TaxID=459472 RepID=UPI00088E44C4|nr:DUF1641 domain-containing protein [Planococcus glaciei]SDG77088.1 Uncharacterized conserved protein YjgD, DUF1641 family [Planococcus glaciei]
MATPITRIKKKQFTPEELKLQRLFELETQVAKQQQSLKKVLEITGELDKAGILDAVNAMVKAREDLMDITVQQATREPVTTLINNLMNAAGALTAIDPATTAKLSASVQSGLQNAEAGQSDRRKLSMFGLYKALRDPDINRSIRYGLHFLKGMGKELERK